MAKQYSAKLTLQDNWTDVINKAIKQTQSLEKEIKKIKDAKISPKAGIDVDKKAMNAYKADIKKLENTKIRIGARMDASVASTLNVINSRVPEDKIIRIKATDEVTKTVTNVQRDLFTMQRQMDVGLKNPFRNFTVSASGAYRSVASIIGGVSALSGIANAVSGGSMASAMAAGAGAGIGTRAFVGVGGRSAGPTGNTMNTARKIFAGAKADVMEKALTRAAGQIDDADILEQMGVHKAWEANSNFAAMINRQKTRMESLGVSGYLPRYQNRTVSVPTGMSYDTGEDGQQEAIPQYQDFTAMTKSMSRAEKVFGAMHNAARASSKGISMTFNKAFNSIKANPMVRMAASAFGNVQRNAMIAGTRMQFAFQRGVYGAGTAMAKLSATASKVKGKITGAFEKTVGPVKNVFSKIGTAMGKLTGKVHSIRMKVNSSPVIAGFRNIGVKLVSIMAGAAKAAGAAVVAGLAVAGKMALGGAAQLETYQVSVAHNLDYADRSKNGGNRTKTAAQVAQEAKDYMNSLKGYANSTPFETGDIYAAGNRAMGIMEGDTAGALNLTKTAGDMAALTPGKSAMDAMEALADLRLGETERMKEFGLKISAEEFAGMVGKTNTADMTDDEMAKAYQMVIDQKVNKRFGGGAQDLSGTATGLFSTAKGKLSSGLTDIGTLFLPKIKGSMEGVIGFIDSASPKVLSFFKVLSGEEAAKSPGMVKFMSIMQQVGSVVQTVMGAVKNAVSAAVPVIGNLLVALAPTFEFVGGLIGRIMETVSGKIGIVGDIINHLSEIWTGIWPTLQSVLETAWAIIEPIFNTLMDTASIIADLFMLTWPGIQSAIETLWAAIEPVLGWFADALEGISDFASGVAEKLDGVVNKKKDVDDSDDTGSKNGRAVGLAYVPYNGYGASLHRGEAILTRQEADAWREGRSGSGKGGNVINITVNGSDNPDAVAQKVYNKLMETVPNMA